MACAYNNTSVYCFCIKIFARIVKYRIGIVLHPKRIVFIAFALILIARLVIYRIGMVSVTIRAGRTGDYTKKRNPNKEQEY